jgi:hypothetical protein
VGTSGAAITPTQPTASSAIASERSVEDNSSSESRTSSATSNIHAGDTRPKVAREDKFEGLIKDQVLRHDPEVAELVWNKTKGFLEYATPDDIELSYGSHELSDICLLELEAFGLVQSSWEVTECASSSSSGASSPPTSDFGQARASSSSVTQSGLGGSGPAKEVFLSNEGPNQQIKSQKKPVTSQSSNFRAFRCFHNAIYPAIFCVNPETRQKFRTCTGPGWKAMQHLKYLPRLFSRDLSANNFRDHVKEVHMKQVKKLNALQCSVCLVEFSDREELQDHTDTVDCPARCLECNEEFQSKALRLEHQKLNHFEEECGGSYMELDEKRWKKIKDELNAFNAYSHSLKKRRCEPDQDMEKWIGANTPQYEVGRSDKARAKSRIELGHWYVMYTSLAPQTKILEHPCRLLSPLKFAGTDTFLVYDSATIPHSDLAEERILLVNDSMVGSKIEVHGPPPSEPELQREWYRDVLRDALRIAARSRHRVTNPQLGASSAPMNTSQSSQGSSSRPTLRQPSDFDLLGINNVSGVSIYPGIDFSEMALTPQSYLPSAEPVGTMTTEPNALLNSALVGGGMNDGWQYTQGGVAQGNGQFQMDQMNEQCQYMFEGNVQHQFGPSGSNILGDDAFSTGWLDPGQGN